MSRLKENDEVVIRCLNDHMDLTEVNNMSNGAEMDEISIISQHSSIRLDYNDKYQEIMRTSGNCEFLRGLLFQDQEEKENKIAQILGVDDDVGQSGQEISTEIMITTDDGEVNISQSESTDKARIRTQFLKVQTKHRQVIPRFIDNEVDNETGKTESSSSATATTLDTQTLTQTAALAASIATMNVVNQPFIKIQTDLEDKLAYVIKQLDNLKRDTSQTDHTTQPTGRVNPNYDSSETIQSERLVNMERIQSQQMNLISELMDTIERQKVADLLTTRPVRKAVKPKIKQEVEVVKKREARPTSRGKQSSQPQRARSTSACSVCDGHSRSQSQSRASRRSSRSRSRGQFLEQLLTSEPTDTRINYENKKSVFNAVTNQETPSLFDLYLDEAKRKGKAAGAASPDLNESGYNTNINNTSSVSSMSGMFDDIKDVLKAVEYSKAKIEASDANRRLKPRDDKMFHILNDASRSEQLRLKKLVDGCVSAISNDVKRVVSQKLDDESKKNTANLKSQSRRPSVSKQPKTDDKKPTGPATSNINKYLGQVYGKSLIEQIKKEKLDEKSRISREKAEKSRQEEENKEKKRRLSRLRHQASTKKPTKPPVKTPTPVQVDDYNQQRPAFVSVPFVPYPENNVHSFGEIKRIRSPSGATERTSSGVKQTEEYYYSKETRIEEEIVADTNKKPAENVIDEDTSEKGYGIELNGAKKPASSNTTSDTAKNPADMSNETAGVMKERSYLEKQTLDWLDQQIIDRFLKQLMLNQADEETSESYTGAASDYYNYEDSESDQSIGGKLNDLVNMIGQRGMQLFVDVGAPVDQNLIEALVLQVLGEKVSSMINKPGDMPNILGLVDGHHEAGTTTVDNKTPIQPPISPRRTIDFLGKQNKDQDILGLDIQTPVPTPPRTQSPIHSTPKPVEASIKPTITPPQLIKLTQVYYDDMEDDGEFEVTLNDSDQDQVDDDNQSKINTISIIVPPTPIVTPTSSPRREATSIQKEEPVVVKTLVTTGVQCDPEPKPEPIIIREPVPVVPEPPRKESPVIEKPKPPPAMKDVSIQQTFHDTTQLTDSTKYSTDMEASTTTMTIETCEEEEEEYYNDSYFSDGAWLMSKSEGQIEQVDHEVYVNLDMQMAVKGMLLNPRKPQQPSVVESDGEIRVDQLNQDNMILYGGRPRTGVNRIHQAAEEGQVDFVSQIVKESRAGNDKSEGEISNPATKEKPKPTCSTKQKQNSSSLKDQITINAMPNEILVKDSNEFVRKIYSSTPDQSIMLGSGGINVVTVSQTSVQLINQVMLDDDENLEEDDDQEEDEHEVSLNLDDLPQKPLHRHYQINDDDDDDTLNNTD